MFDLIASLPETDWARLLLVYCHLLLCVCALALVLSADLRIATGSFTAAELGQIARHTALALTGLWITGLALIYADTGLVPAELLTKPKLLFKLLAVMVLTANGLVLHFFAFPLIARKVPLSLAQSLALTISGAFSTSHWLLAAFIGVARPLAEWPMEHLLAAYVFFCVATFSAAILSTKFIRRRLAIHSIAHQSPKVASTPFSVDVLLIP